MYSCYVCLNACPELTEYLFEYFTVEFMEFLFVITWIWQPNYPSLASDNTLVYLFPHILYYGLSTLADENHQALPTCNVFQPSERAQEFLYVQLVAQKVKVPNSAQSGRCSLSDMVLRVLNMCMTIICCSNHCSVLFLVLFSLLFGVGPT
jgi:hypothetical protein